MTLPRSWVQLRVVPEDAERVERNAPLGGEVAGDVRSLCNAVAQREQAGKRRLRGDVQREAGRKEVASLKDENARLKQLVADYALDLMALKKSLMAES